MKNKILKIEIRPVDDALASFGNALKKLETGQEPEPHFSIGFETVSQFANVFTPECWELISELKKLGTISSDQLAKQLGRRQNDVQQDVGLLMEWLVIEKDEQGQVFVPWDEIDVRLPLLEAA